MKRRALALVLAGALTAAWASPPPKAETGEQGPGWVSTSVMICVSTNSHMEKLTNPRTAKIDGDALEPANVAISHQFHGTDGPEKPRCSIARTPMQWLGAWAHLGKEPEIPFAEGQTGVAVYLGQRPTGGYGVEFVSIGVLPDGAYHLFVREIVPGPEEIVTQALTYPWMILSLETDFEGDIIVHILRPDQSVPGPDKDHE